VVDAPGQLGGFDQVAGGDVVAPGATGQVHDSPYASERCVEAGSGEQVDGHVLDAVVRGAGVSAQHADLMSGGAQQRDEATSEGAGAAGDQDGSRHVMISVSA
jgi:hypothetical protein